MTTIATDGQSMAGDGQVVCNERRTDTQFCKIVKLPDGRIIGCAGSAYDFKPFLDWLQQNGEKPKLWEHSEFLVLNIDGSVESYDDNCRSIREPNVTAVGSGARFAIGAMSAGASVERAVQIACQFDTQSGGEIIVEYITPRLEEVA